MEYSRKNGLLPDSNPRPCGHEITKLVLVTLLPWSAHSFSSILGEVTVFDCLLALGLFKFLAARSVLNQKTGFNAFEGKVPNKHLHCGASN